ncbi:MAG: RagB/SusD family nutrient uptake outer membrane protein [Bacteroidales bacterium]|nr:RagB/SusD family nutrient uptake outer membrane protein [Bacteroidales bacterium]
MKKFILSFSCAFSMAMSFTSCGWLDVDPVSEIPGHLMWQNQRDVNAGIAEIYSSFRTAMRTNWFCWGEMRSDNFKMFNELPGEYSNLILNQMTTDLPSTDWTLLYKVISNCNFAIKYIPGADITDVALKNDYLAQAYAMRALCYFYAVRVWGDVPVYLEPVETLDNAEYKGRSPMRKVLEEVILEDLRTAEELVNPAQKERKRLSRQAIYAIMADVQMWLEDWDGADLTIEKFKASNTLTKFEEDIAVLKNTFVNHLDNKASDNTPDTDEYGGANELVFVIHQNIAEAGLNNYSLIWSVLGCGPGQGSTVVLSDKLQAIYEDLRDGIPADRRFENYLCISGGNRNTYQVHKFIANNSSIKYTEYLNCQMAYPVYRYTDVVFMEAEVKARLDKWQDALNVISPVLARAGVQSRIPSVGQFVNRDQLIDWILEQKQIEQVGEGKRWFDIVRCGKVVEIMSGINPGYTDECLGLFPIHQSLININDKLTQNNLY